MDNDEPYLSYPDQTEVREHLFSLEFSHPGMWLHFMEWLEEYASLGHMPIRKVEYLALMNVGIIRPVFAETTDDETLYLQKVWSFIEHEYKEVEDINDAELVTLSNFSDRVYSIN